MQASPFTAYVSFDFRARFSREPYDISRCLNFCGTLAKTDIAPSRAVTDRLGAGPNGTVTHQGSRLFTCAVCGWWCVRELWYLSYHHIDVDVAGDPCGYAYDCVVVGVNDGPAGDHGDGCEPWLRAMNDPDVYENASKPPLELAELFVQRPPYDGTPANSGPLVCADASGADPAGGGQTYRYFLVGGLEPVQLVLDSAGIVRGALTPDRAQRRLLSRFGLLKAVGLGRSPNVGEIHEEEFNRRCEEIYRG